MKYLYNALILIMISPFAHSEGVNSNISNEISLDSFVSLVSQIEPTGKNIQTNLEQAFKYSKLTDNQQKCVELKVNADSYALQMKDKVRTYMSSHRDSLASDFKILEVTASYFSKVYSSSEPSHSNVEPSEADAIVIDDFLHSEKLADLRNLTNLDSSVLMDTLMKSIQDCKTSTNQQF